MAKIFLIIAAILGGLSVAGGAFATHSLREKLTERALEIFETGARYQMYHALGLLLVGIWLWQWKEAPLSLTIAGWGFIAGVALFSGSLYALSLSGVKWLGAIAPLGGLAFIIGWGCLAVSAWGLK